MQSRTLQRGRALSSAEISLLPAVWTTLRRASTGPRSFERGDTSRWTSPRSPAPGFNGAALFRARRWQRRPGLFRHQQRFNGAALFRARRFIIIIMPTKSHPMLQRGRALSSAEICQSIDGSASGIECFNGAALFRARRSESAHLAPGLSPSFNGAALFRARRYSLAIAFHSMPERCFNGAALFRARR